MGGWNEHYKFNQYKVKLNEVFDNLDEIIYISSTIDYKKVNILLYKIVQNFDYYNYYIPPPEEEQEPQVPTSPEPPAPPIPDEPPAKTQILYGGRVSALPTEAPELLLPPQDTSPITQQEPEQVPPPPKEQPYSSIDTEEMIDIIMKSGASTETNQSFIKRTFIISKCKFNSGGTGSSILSCTYMNSV